MEKDLIPSGYRRVHHYAPWHDANGNGDLVEYVKDNATPPISVLVMMVVVVPVVYEDDGSSSVAA